MTTDVGDRPNDVVGPADDDHRLGVDLHHDVVARLRELADVTGAVPVGEHHALDIEPVDAGRQVELAGQAVPRHTVDDQLVEVHRLWIVEPPFRGDCSTPGNSVSITSGGSGRRGA